MLETRMPSYISDLTPPIVGLILSLGLAVGLTLISDSTSLSWAWLLQSAIYTCVFLSGACAVSLINRLGERLDSFFTVPPGAVSVKGAGHRNSPLTLENPSLRNQQELPLRSSHWTFQSPHHAEHCWREARTCREELGFDPNSDDITPALLKEAIRSLKDNDLDTLAERVCRHLPKDRIASLRFEQDAAWVELEDLNGNGQQLPDPADKSLRDHLNDALVAANGWTALPGNREDRKR